MFQPDYPYPALPYRGRFAPSPTGALHFGSLLAAVGSYLDAKHHHGTWLIRIEDLDTPRCVAGAADDILRTLAVFGLHSDEPILYQSQRTAVYEDALQQLQDNSTVYPCCCTRKEVADSAMNGIEGAIYPGTCRHGIPTGREQRAWRVRTTPAKIEFDDTLQGRIAQHLESEIGDFVVKRADSLFAYQLAVVVDDAAQGITHIVRGCDLLTSTPRQIYLQQLLGYATPHYLHLPVAVNARGEKLSKQTLAQPVSTDNTSAMLLEVLRFLQQSPPAALQQNSTTEILTWAIAHWQPERLAGCRTLQVSA